jgi:LmbE family N-acetylglucosaminyl deacetylase
LYCPLTRGEAGIDGIPPEQSATIREAEEREAARVVGVDTVEFLGLPDSVLKYGVPLRREITRVVRRHKPEIVITLNFADRWAGGGFNAADHPDTRHAVDITDTFEPGVESLKAHRKYLDRLGWEKFDPAESLEGLARQTGTRLGVPMAVGLEVHDLGGG